MRRVREFNDLIQRYSFYKTEIARYLKVCSNRRMQLNQKVFDVS